MTEFTETHQAAMYLSPDTLTSIAEGEPKTQQVYGKTYTFTPELAKWALPLARKIDAAYKKGNEGKFMTAINMFEELLTEEPQCRRPKTLIGALYLAFGSPKLGLARIREAAKEDPDNEEIRCNLKAIEAALPKEDSAPDTYSPPAHVRNTAAAILATQPESVREAFDRTIGAATTPRTQAPSKKWWEFWK